MWFLFRIRNRPAQVTGMVILYEVFPLRQRGLVLGLLLLAGSMGPTIGPTLGGYLVEGNCSGGSPLMLTKAAHDFPCSGTFPASSR